MKRKLLAASLLLLGLCTASRAEEKPSWAQIPNDPIYKNYTIPVVDISGQTERQFLVDKEPGQYLGHPTTALMGDGKTIYTVYPKAHADAPIVMKKSEDGGITWSERLPTPKSWETNRMCPTIFRLADANDVFRVLVFSGTPDFMEGKVLPVRMSVSSDEGKTWSELEPLGEWGGVMAMSDIEPVHGKKGHYLAMFFSCGGYVDGGDTKWDEIKKRNGLEGKPGWQGYLEVGLHQTFTEDGGLTWSKPELIIESNDIHLIEPAIIRSPDGKKLAALIRDISCRYPSQIIFSEDEGKTWTAPRPMPAALCGDRHTSVYTQDGRLFISFRDRPSRGMDSVTKGDWVAWVGTFDDLVNSREGQYRIRLMDDKHGYDCSYPGVLLLEDDTIVTTTYGRWTLNEPPYIMTVRLKLQETDEIWKKMTAEK